MSTVWTELTSLPQVQELLQIIRSDNSLIALGVAYREVTWTQFIKWLLDPKIAPDRASIFLKSMLQVADELRQRVDTGNCDELGRANLERFAALANQQPSIITAKTEVVEGKSGRSDVVVDLKYGDTSLTMIIENKILASEHDEQLAGYVNQRLKALQADQTNSALLPFFIQLGDTPEKTCSCDWAIVWKREDVTNWLKRAVEECNSGGISVPSAVTDYLKVFEGWNLAAQVRGEHEQLIRRITVEKRPDEDEWELLHGWIAVTDEPFFKQVLNSAEVKQVLRGEGQNEWSSSTSGSILGRNELMQIWKDTWTLGKEQKQNTGLNLHFESRYRGQFQLDVELDPYEGSLEKNKARQDELKQQLELKCKLITALRDRIIAEKQVADAHSRYLREANAVSTCCAVKFKELGDDCSVDECAKFVADVIREVSPIVDKVIAEAREQWHLTNQIAVGK